MAPRMMAPSPPRNALTATHIWPALGALGVLGCGRLAEKVMGAMVRVVIGPTLASSPCRTPSIVKGHIGFSRENLNPATTPVVASGARQDQS